MTKMSAVVFGFLLTLVVSIFFGRYEFWGLLIVGFIVGYMAHEGALGGMWNAALAGAFGTIVCSILFVALDGLEQTQRFHIGNDGLAGLGGGHAGILAAVQHLGLVLGGLAGFTVSGVTSLLEVIKEVIKYMVAMGITGAIGGALSNSSKQKE